MTASTVPARRPSRLAALLRRGRQPDPEPADVGDSDVNELGAPWKRLRRPGTGRARLHVPRHRATTAHACTLYPWGIHGSLGHQGVYLGQDMLAGGGAFVFDPFEAYQRFAGTGAATNTNMMILGQPGMGKSALIKSLLFRSAAVYGSQRFLAIVDVKGEYRALAGALGLPVVRLTPGGTVRVNPLEVSDTDDDKRVLRQTQMMQALLATVLARPLQPREEAAVWSVIDQLGRRVARPTVADVANAFGAPTAEMAAASHLEHDAFVEATGELRLATEKLIDRSLRGMFDGHSTVHIDPAGRGVVIDISDVHHQSDALPLVMVAATAWLQELLIRPNPNGARKIQLLDESWRMVAYEGTARYLQACWKLGRTYGTANIAILHKPGDLAAQSADGSATAKISQGLVADTAIRISFAQARSDLDTYGDLLGWSNAERARIAELRRGESLWKIGAHGVQLSHGLPDTGIEARLCDTDQALTGPPSAQAATL